MEEEYAADCQQRGIACRTPMTACHYASRYGVAALQLHMGIHLHRHAAHPEWLLLHSPRDGATPGTGLSRIAAEANGVVVDTSGAF